MSTDSTEAKAPSRGPQIVIATAVALLVTLVLIFLNHADNKAVSAKMTGYKVVSPTQFQVSFEVNKAYIAQATCRIEALDKNFNVIGAVDNYIVGPQTDHHRKTEHTVLITVAGTPVTGQVESCLITRNH